MEVITDAALSKLNVAQLKALCKDRKLTGCSKLKKSDLVQRLVNYQTVHPATAPTAPPSSTPAASAASKPAISTPKASKKAKLTARDLPAPDPPSSPDFAALPTPEKLISPNVARNTSMLSGPSLATEPSQSRTQFSQHPPSQSARHPSLFNYNVPPSPPARSPTQSHSSRDKSLAAPIVPKKRKAPESDAQKSKAATAIRAPDVSMPADKIKLTLPQTTALKAPNKAVSEAPNFLPPIAAVSCKVLASTLPATKRFVPLAVKNPAPKSIPAQVPEQTISQQSVAQLYLDSPELVPVALDNVSLPPSLSQRKFVSRYALILSQVPVEDLKQCMLVSRMFRYAAYISSSYRLLRDFSGYRFGLILEMYPRSMTNMWPYLCQRRREVRERKAKYQSSFLANVFDGKEMIASRLWMSPDHDKQVIVAQRFLLTRLFFTISIGEPKDWFGGQVIDAQPLVPGEIWCITMKRGPTTEIFYVLEATCEVVGRPVETPNPTSMSVDVSSGQVAVRVDWSNYIAYRLLPPTIHTAPPTLLMEHISWTNHEEYERGISRHWLRKVRREGKLGSLKEVVAGRYILACVVANSVSGKWKSATEMALDFAGSDALPNHGPVKTKVPRVNLFLPAHHHVESVHFTTDSGMPLHGALAVVQTPGREYFILKDNGMQVGTEEEGVAEVWMSVLKCTNAGQ